MHSWLANTDPETAWAHFAWPDFPVSGSAPLPLAILPLHGFAGRGEDTPVDAEELIGARVLRAATAPFKANGSLRILPPVRQVLAERRSGFFGLDPETACDFLMNLSRGVRDSGCTKLLFFNTSAVSAPLAATAALDARAEFGLQTYVVQAADLGLDFNHPAGDVHAAAKRLQGLISEILAHRCPPGTPAQVPAIQAGDKQDDAPFPLRFRNRYLGSFTASRLRACAGSADALAILPVAAIEQHGHHLPVGVDAILGQALLAAALDTVPADAPIFAAPPLLYGKSIEHAGFAGTLSIDGKTLRRSVLSIARDLGRLGFRRLAVTNFHGGNIHVLDMTLREIREDLGIEAVRLRAGYQPEMDPQELAWGMHADEWETSLMLACAPECVHMEKAVREYPAHVDDPGLLRPEKSAAIFGWLTRDLSNSGVLGDPTRADADKGRRWLAEGGALLSRRLLDFARGS
ncbi:creatinine amidohydrolase [mine drainage metagenome]|uniref:Creatinine amidohydrolase n=1 Tax=mine drainage metagenome TaxID=410659 RepID=A0A1J5TFK2_9ZZZZ